MSAPAARRSITRLSGAAAQQAPFGSTTPITLTSASLRQRQRQAAQQQQPRSSFSTATKTAATAPVRPTTTTTTTKVTAVTTWTARAKEAVERSRARQYSQGVEGKGGENKIWEFEDVGHRSRFTYALVFGLATPTRERSRSWTKGYAPTKIREWGRRRSKRRINMDEEEGKR